MDSNRSSSHPKSPNVTYWIKSRPVARSILAVGLVALAAMLPDISQLDTLPCAIILMVAGAASARLTGWKTITAIVVVIWFFSLWHYIRAIMTSEQALMIAIGASLTTFMARLPVFVEAGPRGLYPETIETLFNALLETVPLLLISPKGDVRRASAAAAEMFGASRSALEKLKATELIQGFDIKAHASKQTPSGPLRSDAPYWQALALDDTAVPVELHLYQTPNGPLIRLSDLRPSQAADAQARELHSQLNKVWRLNSLGEMAATLAHELNQPLGAAASYLHAAQEDMKRAGPLGQSALKTSELAKAQMLRAGQIIRRMRELLSLEMRTLSTEKVRRVVEDVLPILNLTGQARSIHISVDIDSPDNVRMDRIQFQQALVNLVRNAVEASPEQSRVLITGRIISDKVYEIAVEDSGPGIPPDQIDTVFQPMTTTKKGGMGLGLSVTRTIVESHGGSLRVGTSRWGGARFSFNLMTSTLEANL